MPGPPGGMAFTELFLRGCEVEVGVCPRLRTDTHTPRNGKTGPLIPLLFWDRWHNDCFNCKKCSMSLVDRGFLTERNDILCPECGKDV
ncbi:hypothetical protein CRUP_028039 [Coryphaenoides rupestris]|nr:hypothetical protein CRUP_028039 [Coryphaenoides rupestris]